MSIRKRGTCSGKPVISSSVLVCSKCGHTKTVKGDENTNQDCPKCHSPMNFVSCNCSVKNTDDTSK